MSGKKPLKAKNMMYVQQIFYIPSYSMDNMLDLIENVVKPTKYAVILHDKCISDKGTPEAPHIHAMLSFKNARSVASIAKLLNDKPQTVEMWKGDARNGLAYLIHATDNARMKYQYDIADVYANFDYAEEMRKITREVTQSNKYSVNMLLDLFYSGKITREEVERQLSGSQYGKNRKAIADINAKVLEYSANEWRKEKILQGEPVRVVWIYGESGTGKTSFAKAYAEKEGQPYFVSGSSRDIFQQYNGEHTLILDEFRPNIIPYQDLLKILDPFGAGLQTMLPCRYNDKALACDLIIITSPYNPYSFYCEKMFGHIDSFDQLLRRISLTIEMTFTEIRVAEFDTEHADRDTCQYAFIPIPATSRQNTYSSINYPASASNFLEFYNSMWNDNEDENTEISEDENVENEKGEQNGDNENEAAPADAQSGGATD